MTPELKYLCALYSKACDKIINDVIADTGVRFVDRCEHESDGKLYWGMFGYKGGKTQCVKCGNFYK